MGYGFELKDAAGNITFSSEVRKIQYVCGGVVGQWNSLGITSNYDFNKFSKWAGYTNVYSSAAPAQSGYFLNNVSYNGYYSSVPEGTAHVDHPKAFIIPVRTNYSGDKVFIIDDGSAAFINLISSNSSFTAPTDRLINIYNTEAVILE